jgi:hypothetical protein
LNDVQSEGPVMNAIMERGAVEADEGRPAGRHAGMKAEGCESDRQPSCHTLRRNGRKAIRFEGWQLIEAAGSSHGGQVWHDLNIYRTVSDSIVVELIARHATADHHDLSQVRVFDDLPSAADWLEAYRPAENAPIPAGLGATDTALPWAVLQAVQLRQRIERIELDYQALLSEVFAALDLTEPAEPPFAPAPESPGHEAG